MYSCHGVFTDQVIFRKVLARIWKIFNFKSHKPVSKTYRPKNHNFYLLMTTFSFLISDTRSLHFLGKNYPKMVLTVFKNYFFGFFLISVQN